MSKPLFHHLQQEIPGLSATDYDLLGEARRPSDALACSKVSDQHKDEIMRTSVSF